MECAIPAACRQASDTRQDALRKSGLMARRKRKTKSISTLATTTVENPDWRPDRDGEKPFPRYVDAVMRCRPGTFAWRFGRDKNSLEYQAGNRFAMLWER